MRGDDLVVFGEFLDGEKLTEFWRSGDGLPLDIALRILLDVLTGVGALHALRDSNQQPMKLTHGEISPSTILFGSDGVARVLHAVARRAADATAEEASLPYLAPEVHSNDAHDGRADVFSVGVLLWELLEGKRLSGDGEEAAGLRVRSGPLPAPAAPEKLPWAKALVPVVVKALAAAPEDRWTTAAAMAAEIRKAAGLKLAAASASAAFAKSKFGDRVKERRARWEARSSVPPTLMASPRPVAASPLRVPASAIALAALLIRRTTMLLRVPRARSEEFSSSVLESFRPPPPPALGRWPHRRARRSPRGAGGDASSARGPRGRARRGARGRARRGCDRGPCRRARHRPLRRPRRPLRATQRRPGGIGACRFRRWRSRPPRRSPSRLPPPRRWCLSRRPSSSTKRKPPPSPRRSVSRRRCRPRSRRPVRLSASRSRRRHCSWAGRGARSRDRLGRRRRASRITRRRPRSRRSAGDPAAGPPAAQPEAAAASTPALAPAGPATQAAAPAPPAASPSRLTRRPRRRSRAESQGAVGRAGAREVGVRCDLDPIEAGADLIRAARAGAPCLRAPAHRHARARPAPQSQTASNSRAFPLRWSLARDVL